MIAKDILGKLKANDVTNVGAGCPNTWNRSSRASSSPGTHRANETREVNTLHRPNSAKQKAEEYQSIAHFIRWILSNYAD